MAIITNAWGQSGPTLKEIFLWRRSRKPAQEKRIGVCGNCCNPPEQQLPPAWLFFAGNHWHSDIDMEQPWGYRRRRIQQGEINEGNSLLVQFMRPSQTLSIPEIIDGLRSRELK